MNFLAKRVAEAAEQGVAKKARYEMDDDDEAMGGEMGDDEAMVPALEPTKTDHTSRLTEKFIFERLTPEMTANLIFQFAVSFIVLAWYGRSFRYHTIIFGMVESYIFEAKRPLS